MQKRRLGRADVYLTPLGLGTWAIGGPWAYGWGPQDAANLAFVEGLRRIAEGEGCSLAGLAIAWVLRHPETASAMVGARSPAQFAETVKNDQALAEVLREIELARRVRRLMPRTAPGRGTVGLTRGAAVAMHAADRE